MPAGDDDVVRTDLDEQVALRDRNEALLEEADRERRARGSRRPACRAASGELARAGCAVALGQQRAAHLRPFLDDDHRAPLPGGLDGSLEPGLAASDHDRVDVAVLDVDALLPRAVLVELAETGGVAEHLLVERPQLPRAG